MIYRFALRLEKKSKEIKIPNLAPFKQELLQQAQEAKKQVRNDWTDSVLQDHFF